MHDVHHMGLLQTLARLVGQTFASDLKEDVCLKEYDVSKTAQVENIVGGIAARNIP